MEFLNLVASLTQKRAITSAEIVDPITVAPFAYTESLQGKVIVLRETGDPTAPTEAVGLDASSGVALTDGRSIIYANALILPISGDDDNEVNFTLVVDSAELTAAFAATELDWIPAYLEVRIVKDSQDELLLREAVIIQLAASAAGALGNVPASVAKVLFNDTIITLRDDPNSLEAFSTLLPQALPTLTLLIIVKDDLVSFWQLVTGAADVDNLDGEVQPLDYDSLTNNRHWEKVGGL